jgi:putative endonuclease
VTRWFVYIARCADDTLYCGITNDLAARVAAHDAGTGARYTRARGPIEIVLARRCATKSTALRLEYRIKQLTRAEKIELVAAPRRLARIARAISTSRRSSSGRARTRSR